MTAPKFNVGDRVLAGNFPATVTKVKFTYFIVYDDGESDCYPEDEVMPECDHVEGGEIAHTTEGINVWLHFTYCPKCGEKL